MKTIVSVLCVCLLGCSESAFLVVSLEAPPQTNAPLIDTLVVTTSAEVDGELTQKDVTFAVENQSLPVSFFLEFSGEHRGLLVDLSLSGLANGVEVLRASGEAKVGEEVDVTAQFCGDLVLQNGEACDDGPQNSDTLANACRVGCQLPFCGDGVVDAAEGCDDGANVAGDGCDAVCVQEFCGDGFVNNVIESCDDGNTVSGDGCAGDCSKTEVCGDGTKDEGEECDDGNNVDADGCEADCTAPACGNGIVDPGELCFVVGPTLTVDAGPVGVVVADLNGDGLNDLATANDGATDTVNVLLNLGVSGFAARLTTNLATNTQPSALVAGDVDNNGAIDLAIASAGLDQVQIFKNGGAGQTQLALGVLSVGDNPVSLALGDVTGDGKLDLVTANLGTLNVAGEFVGVGKSFLRHSVLGDNFSFDAAITLPNPTGDLYTAVGLASLNNQSGVSPDARLDLVSASSRGFDLPKVERVINNGNAVNPFSNNPAETNISPPNPNDTLVLAIGDVDGDGAQDIIIGHTLSNSISVLFGLGNGAFATEVLFSVGESQVGISTGDLNQDGIFDVVVLGTGSVHLLLGQPDRSLVSAETFVVGSAPRAVAVGDINGDSVPDVVVAVASPASLLLFVSDP